MCSQPNEKKVFLASSRLKKHFSFNNHQHRYVKLSLSRKSSDMLLLLTIIIVFLIIVTVKFVIPTLVTYSQLQKDYQNISLLPLSSIPFVGNANHLGKGQQDFFQLICRMSKVCQEQDKGIFCLWYALWPMIFLCSPHGLEVFQFFIIFFS